MIFNWIKLGIGFLNCLIAMMIVGGAYLVITHFEFEMMTNIAIGCGAFLFIVGAYYITMSRLGYSIRTGQLAITERANAGNDLPPNPIEFSKDIVSKRFGSNRKFYLVSRDIAIVIRQFVRVISRGFSVDSDLPDLRISHRLLILLSHTAIYKADDCCIAYALRKRDYELNAAIVDALTILAQQWNVFIRRAFKLSLFVIVGCIFLFLIFYLPGLAVSQSLSISSLPWMGISFLLMLSFKIAFFDSWVQTKMTCEFLDITNDTAIDGKLYQKLDSWSSMYAHLRKLAQKATEKAEKAEKAENPTDVDNHIARETKDDDVKDCCNDGDGENKVLEGESINEDEAKDCCNDGDDENKVLEDDNANECTHAKGHCNECDLEQSADYDSSSSSDEHSRLG